MAKQRRTKSNARQSKARIQRRGQGIDVSPLQAVAIKARRYQDVLQAHGPVKVLVKDGVRVSGGANVNQADGNFAK